MARRGYKQIKDKLYREIKRRSLAEAHIVSAEARAERAEDEANYYKKRFREFGSNVDTVEPGSGKLVNVLKWELKQQAWGDYCVVDDRIVETHDTATVQKILSDRVIEGLARALIENNLVQFVIRDPDMHDPFNRCGTYAAKLYVVPWEQMPHSKILELKQYSDEVIDNAYQP